MDNTPILWSVSSKKFSAQVVFLKLSSNDGSHPEKQAFQIELNRSDDFQKSLVAAPYFLGACPADPLQYF